MTHNLPNIPPGCASALEQLFHTIDFDPAARIALIEKLRWVNIPGGELLCRQGDTADALYLVTGGRLRVFVQDQDRETVLSKPGPGELIGDSGILNAVTRTASIQALRDSILATLSRGGLEDLLRAHPLAAARLLAHSLAGHLNAMPQSFSAGTEVYALSSDNPTVPAAETACGLATALSRYGRTLVLDSAACEHALGRKGIAQSNPGDAGDSELTAWLSTLERDYRYLVYLADPHATPWTRRCLRQADHHLRAANAKDAPRRDSIILDSPPCTLLLLHETPEPLPSAAEAWIQVGEATRFYHISRGCEADYARTARFLTNRAVGLVLSGGAAKGLAHIGVIQAMEELNIPIDIVGGTSIGAVIAAHCALLRSPEQIRQQFAQFRFKRHHLPDYITLPLVSLLNGKKLGRVFERMFGTRRIEDMKRKFYAVGCNLSRADITVYSQGSLKEAVDDSNGPPGLLPPNIRDGELVVDGMLLNNLPVDVMRERYPGSKIIVVDVTHRPEMRSNRDYQTRPGGFEILASRFRPDGEKILMPSLLQIAGRAAIIGSVAHQKKMRGLADVYLQPAVNYYPPNAFSRIAEITRAGYECALPVLAQQRPVLLGEEAMDIDFQ